MIVMEGLNGLTPQTPDRLLLFIYLIDILYDAHCRVICASTVPIDDLYQGDKYAEAFARTRSRLIEMQSEQYLYRDQMGEEFMD